MIKLEPVIKSLQSLAAISPLVILITWLDSVEILLENFLDEFSLKILDVFFSRSDTIGHNSGRVGQISVKRKGGASLGYWNQELLCDWCESKAVRYWADCMALPVDHTHDLDLEVSRSMFEIALFQEWEDWLTWNKRDMSWSFINMTMTFE